MLPPSNNRDNLLLRYLRKLAAVTRRPQLAATSTRPPPPPYTASFSSQDSDYDWDEDDDSNEDSNDYYKPGYSEPSANKDLGSSRISASDSNTITVDLNSSIQIKGDANTVIIASGAMQHKSSPPHSSFRHQQQETSSSMPSSNLANTTSAIVAALQKSSIIPTQARSGSGSTLTASVSIDIDAGIRVGGARNIVSFGPRPAPLARQAHPIAGRKRRAQSEPVPGTGAADKRTRVA
ncbi:hypothetical protein BJX64DRAFT_269983 [Aspergillus heterothallicus]